MSEPGNTFEPSLTAYLIRAVHDLDARVYAWGRKWGPESKRDEYFGFQPSRGVHDVHMNQGKLAL